MNRLVRFQEVDEEAIVCQRENPFYVDTVRAFRDRRYVFKRRLKDAEELRETLEEQGGSFQAKKEADDQILLNDSLQLAHKCILNSFYGYVKREAARWYSMEMGAVVTKIGADLIKRAKCVCVAGSLLLRRTFLVRGERKRSVCVFGAES